MREDSPFDHDAGDPRPDEPDAPAPAGPFDSLLTPQEPARPPAFDPGHAPASTPWAPPPAPGNAPRPAPYGTFATTGVPHFTPPATPHFPPPAAPVPPAPARAGEPPGRRSALRLVGRGVRELAETVILALLIFLLVRAVVQNFQVEGRSMEPTLESGWYLLVNKALYWEVNLNTVDKFLPFVDPGDDPTRYVFRGPRRGDIIVFRAPDQPANQPERDFIKRIIGLPGETVQVRDCTVFINGEPIDEPYVQERPSYTLEPEVVPPGHYFVLGDNRNNSSDSHSWGMLPKENIIGQAWLTYWPFDSFGLVDDSEARPGSFSGNAAPDPSKQAPCPAG